MHPLLLHSNSRSTLRAPASLRPSVEDVDRVDARRARDGAGADAAADDRAPEIACTGCIACTNVVIGYDG